MMPRSIKIVLAAVGLAALLPIALILVLFLLPDAEVYTPAQVRREIPLPNQASLVIDGQTRSRSEHGFSQQAGYRPRGSAKIEWFGDLSDGVEPQVYDTGPLTVVMDLPAAQLYVRRVSPIGGANWKNIVLIFPDDLGPFAISYYAERNGMTEQDVSRIDQLGGKRDRKYPTTYIQSFDPKTRDLECSYQVDNTSSWLLHLRLSNDGTHLALIGIGGSPR